MGSRGQQIILFDKEAARDCGKMKRGAGQYLQYVIKAALLGWRTEHPGRVCWGAYLWSFCFRAIER